MKENKYDDINFFNQYKKMERSTKGLEAAGEWHELEKMLPEFNGKKVLDLGCGFGWHCRYAVEKGADSVIGIDISENMLKEAKKMTSSNKIKYICKPIEDINYSRNSFDIVISSLAFHYIKSFENICENVSKCLVKGGKFIFSVEHPIFTAYGTQDWFYDQNGNLLHWPVDKYFNESIRKANFLGQEVMKYHRTLTSYISDLINSGFEITKLVEPTPSDEMLKNIPAMNEELRRPMMLLISAMKK